MCSVDIPIMRDTTDATRPFSYPQRPQSTRPGLLKTGRASDAGAGFIDFAVVHPQPIGLVFQECAKLMPTGIVDRLRHAGFGKFRAGDIAHDDQLGAANDLCGFLVRPVFAGVFDLGVKGSHPAFLACTLRHGQIVCVAAREVFPVVLSPIRTRCLIFETQINANLSITKRRTCVFDFTLEVDVPTSTSVLGEASGFDVALDRARQPEFKGSPKVGDRVACNLQESGLERHPAQRLLAAAPLETPLAKLLASGGVLSAYLRDGIRVQAQLFRRASRQADQVVGSQHAAFSAPCQDLDFIAEVPHGMHSPRKPDQVVAVLAIFRRITDGNADGSLRR